MNKNELLIKLSSRTGKDKTELRYIVEEAMSIITEEIKKGERVSFHNFGTFKPRMQTSRLARNPRTGNAVQLIPRTIMHFKCSPSLLDTINKETKRG